jgi:phenylpropionate dioxygenase-like ring-hydroxylating dioxygenase large terminal subunit
MTIIEERAKRATQVPFAMESPLHVRRERYFNREFFEMEKELLWPRVWQMACRLEEIPDPGDFVEYEICDQSIIVVRQEDMSVKAFYNACRHRATELCKGSGRAPGGQIKCPFHGWRWNLDGTPSFLYGQDGFAEECLQPADIKLQECRVETWGACAWINMDPNARPLHEALSPAAGFLEAFGVDDLRVYWWKEAIIRANWKLAQEAFHEGWHLMATHPQLVMGAGESYPPGAIEHSVFANGHSRFQGAAPSTSGVNVSKSRGKEGFLGSDRLLWEGQDAMVLERDIRVFEGVRNKGGLDGDYPAAAIAALIEYAEGAGIPIRATPESRRLWGGEIFLFPNFFCLPKYSNALSYRIRPYSDDPEMCRFEVWSLTMPAADQEVPRARLQGRFAPDDPDNWGRIPRQDFSNLERQQRGLHSRSFKQLRLATVWERAISNMHEELDKYLAGE